MANPFIDKGAFTPRLTEEIKNACRYNAERGLMSGDMFAGNISANGLGDNIKAATAESEVLASIRSGYFDKIKNTETQNVFEASFAATEALFNHLRLTTPTAEQCVEAGVDLCALGEAYDRMTLAGLEPAVVLAPYIDLYSWRRLYRGITNDYATGLTGSPVKCDGLYVASAVSVFWRELSVPPKDVPCIKTHDSVIPWSLRLIPSALEAPTEGIQTKYYHEGPHPTVSEYLSLQATRLQAYKKPLDKIGTVWLNGTFMRHSNGKMKAMIGYWDTFNNYVRIDCNDSHRARAFKFEVRKPVWE